jgi:hypothetical protein
LKNNNIYECKSCDHTTHDKSPLILANEAECDHHKSLGHIVKIRQEQINTEQTSEKLAKFATKKMQQVAISDSDSTRVFTKVPIHNHWESMELDEKNPKTLGWLQVAYWNESKKMVSNDVCASVIGFLKQKVLMDESSKIENVHLRCAYVNDEIYYDLGIRGWKFVKISANGINFVDYGIDSPFFTRTNKTGIQTIPNLRPDGNALDELVKLIKVPNPEMFKVHLISMFVDGLPMPCFAIRGHAGSAKSSTSSMIKRIVDPSGNSNDSNLKSFPHGEDNFVVSLSGSYLSAFENISHIDKTTTNMLCRAITGGAFEKRGQYTNGDVFSINIKRKILINGIDFQIKESDLLDRTIQYNLERIPKEQRLSEKKIEKIFQKLLPDILGEIFLILQKVLKIIDSVEDSLPHTERMSDFTIFGEAIYQSMGHKEGEFSKLYDSELKTYLQNLHDSNPIVKFCEEILGDNDEIEMTAEQVFKKISEIASRENYSDGGLPKSANGVRAWVDKSKSLLDMCHIDISSYQNTVSKEISGFTPHSTIYVIRHVVSVQTKLEDID